MAYKSLELFHIYVNLKSGCLAEGLFSESKCSERITIQY